MKYFSVVQYWIYASHAVPSVDVLEIMDTLVQVEVVPMVVVLSGKVVLVKPVEVVLVMFVIIVVVLGVEFLVVE